MITGNGAVQQQGHTSVLNNVMRGLSAPFVALMQRWMPNAFIFAALLTILTFVICIFLTEASAGEIIRRMAADAEARLQSFAAPHAHAASG